MRETVEIQLGGKPYRLRPTFDAYVQIEERHGSLRALWEKVAMGLCPLAALGSIAYIGILANEDAPQSFDEQAVCQRLFEQGAWSDEVREPLGRYLMALGWTPAQLKKIDAERAVTT